MLTARQSGMLSQIESCRPKRTKGQKRHRMNAAMSIGIRVGLGGTLSVRYRAVGTKPG